MADIRRRKNNDGTYSYQVRYPSRSTKSGYAYKSFDTAKEARAFREDSRAREQAGPRSLEVQTVEQAIDKWLDICRDEGCDGRDPITAYTFKTYSRRAEIMKSYPWDKPLYELETPDVVAFRSYLLSQHSRHLAGKVLSSFHSAIKEMSLRGFIPSNVVAGVSVRMDSRYDTPVEIPNEQDVLALLSAADRLANSKNRQTARTWQRYRPILYLAADSGMRPQEYLALPIRNIHDNGVKVDQAIERGGYRISVTKTPAGRRFIELGSQTLDMLRHYAEHHAAPSEYGLAFPTATGHWQCTDHWRKRGFYAACMEAGLTRLEEGETGQQVEKPRYKPYDLRHFFASVHIARKTNLKKLQQLMGHEDIKTTLNVYGHLIEQADASDQQSAGLIATLKQPE